MICLELVFKKKIVGAVSFCCGVSVLLRERLIVSQAAEAAAARGGVVVAEVGGALHI